MRDRIKKLSDIVDNNYRFEFKYSIEEPLCEFRIMINIKIWIIEDGVDSKGHKTSRWLVKVYSSSCVPEDSVLCKWEDVREYQTRK